MKQLLAAFALITCVAQAWDPAGHMLVDEIAWRELKPEVRTQAGELVKALNGKFNEGRAYNFITAGCWMDDMRSAKGYQWAKWHYVTIPYTPDGREFTLPQPPHLVWALEESIKTLRDPAAEPARRTEAAGMIIHLVGDIHQPLHTTDRNDRGGNGYLIFGVPFSDLNFGSISNLHTFWDKAFRFDVKEGAIVEAWLAPTIAKRPVEPGTGVIAEEAAKIIERYPRGSFPELKSAPGIEDWARASHLIGCLSAYPEGTPPGDTEARTLTPEFVRQSRPIAEKRVALAGYRLADLLNAIFAP